MKRMSLKHQQQKLKASKVLNQRIRDLLKMPILQVMQEVQVHQLQELMKVQ